MASLGSLTVSNFTKLMRQIKGDLTKDDLSDMKFACLDKLALGTMENVDDFLGLVTKLETSRLIDREKPNLNFLIELLETGERKDIAKKVRDFQEGETSSISQHSPSLRIPTPPTNWIPLENQPPVDSQQKLLAALNVNLQYRDNEEVETDEETQHKVPFTNKEPAIVGIKNGEKPSKSDVGNNNVSTAKGNILRSDIECDGPQLDTHSKNITAHIPSKYASSVGSSSSSCKLLSDCSLPIHAPTISIISEAPSIEEHMDEHGPLGSTPRTVSHQTSTFDSNESSVYASTQSNLGNQPFEGVLGFEIHENRAIPSKIPSIGTESVGEEVLNLGLRGPDDTDPINHRNPELGSMEHYNTANSSLRYQPYSTSHDHQKIPTDRTAKIKLWSYQKELAVAGLEGQNSIICAPTGSGKTFTAAHVCLEQWHKAKESGSDYKALFIVCIRNLIEQQSQALQQIFRDDLPVCGIKQTDKLKEVLGKFDVIVLTAQIFVNCLESGEVRIDDFNMIMMDECHHTNLEHPYNEIMKYYHKEKRRTTHARLPQMLGLTASLGVGNSTEKPVRHYIKLCGNLDCHSVSHVRDRENMKELLKQNPKPRKDQILKCRPRPDDDMFSTLIHRFMNQIKALIPELMNTCPPPHGTQKFENWMVEWRQKAEENNKSDMIDACQALLMLNNALQLYDLLRRKEALGLIKDFFQEYLPSEPSLVKKQMSDHFEVLLPDFERLARSETLEDNEKLLKLHNLLEDLFDTNLESKGILLTRTLNNVKGLLEFIRDQAKLKHNVKASKFVGQGRKEGTMTDVEQEDTLKLFRKDNSDPNYVNLLVATDVAQEGLDMPKCNFVIRYDFVSNEIGSVQSRGRARAKNSECYLIVNKGSVNESREMQNLEKEHLMLQALQDIDQMDQADIESKVKQFQEMWWKKILTKDKQKFAGSSLFDPTKITIFCKYCKTELAKGSDMRKRGSNFICVADGIETKVKLRRKPPMEMRYDSQIGDNLCANRSCERAIGPRVMYKQGARQYGFIFGKDHVMYKLDGKENFISVKQWSKVPFQIEEENLWS